jgi:autotransporter-associated beta strand protein
MKQTHRNPLLRNFVFAATICLTFGQAAHAGSVYWDTNGITAGSGTATGNWGSSLFWTTTEAGTVATNGTLPTAHDDVFIAAGTSGTTGTITIGTTKVAGSLTLQEPATAVTGVTISGGTSLTLGGGTTVTKGLFVTGLGIHTVSTPLILSGANTIQNAGTGTLTVNGGLTGTGDLTLRNNSSSATGIRFSTQLVNPAGSITNTGSSTGTVVIGNTNGASGAAGLGADVTSFSQDSSTSPLQLLNANNSTYTGNYNINAGIMQFAGTNATGSITATNASSVINLGATSGTAAATLSIVNNAVSGKLNNNINVRAGSTGVKTIITNSTSTSFATSGLVTLDDNLTLSPPGLTTFGFTFNNSIVDGSSGSKGITKSAAGSVYLTASNTYSGATTLTNGTLLVTEINGSLPNTSGVAISGGTFQLNNTAVANNTNRIPDSTVITLTGGTLDFKNDAGLATNFSETVAITAAGAGIISASQAALGQTSTLTIGTFLRTAGSSLSFTGTGLGVDDRNRILFTTPPTLTNGVIPWATSNATTFAGYDLTNGVTAATTTDIDAQGSTIADAPSSNLRILPAGAGSAIALGAADTTINTLVQANTTLATTPTIDTASKTLRVNSILLSSTASTKGLTIGSAANDGTLTTGTPGGEFSLINNSASTLTLNAVIANNTSGSLLSKSGSGDTIFAGTNIYTGDTSLKGGIITAANSSAFSTGAVTILPSTTRLVINDGLTLSNNITIKGGGASFRGLLENSSTGEAILGGIITIDGALSGGGHFASATGGTLKVTGAINSASQPVSSRIGTVIFSGGGSYANFVINEGTVRLGATNGLSTTATADVGASGTTVLDLAGFDQTFVGITRSGGVSGTIGNSSTATSSILTVTGTSTFAGVIANTVSPGDKLTTLKIANAANITLTGNYTANTPDIQSGGTLTIGAGGGDSINPSTKSLLVPSGATLKNTGSNRVQNDTVITVNSGGTFDQNGQADTIGYINGAGSIINLNAGLTLNMPLVGSGSNFSGTISGTSGISVAGVGTGGSDTNLQILSGVNFFTGNISVQRGLLRITNSSALGEAPIAGTKTISISANSNKFLELDGTAGDITLPATFLFSTSGANGTIRNLAGNNTIDGAFSLTSGNGNTKIVSDAGSLTLNGNVTTVAGAGANRVLDLDGTSTANNAVNGVIGDGGGFLTGVTKSGIGKWTLGGTNTYTGNTSIIGGILALGASGSIDNSPALSISAGAELDTTAKTSHTLPATVTIGINGTASTNGLIDAAGKDLVISGATVTFDETGVLAAPVYVLANYATITGTATFAAVESVPGYTLFYNHNGGTQIALVKDTSDYLTWGGPYSLGAGSEGGDLDNDGLTNFQEYAFGLNPNSGSSVNPITQQLDKSTGLFKYTRRSSTLAIGVTYTYESSTTLSGAWTPFTPDSTATNSVTPTEEITVDIPDLLLGNTKLFVRVKALK